MPRRLALLVATYLYQDAALRQLTAPGQDAEALAEVLRHPEIADFDVTVLVNEPHHVVGDAIGEFYHNRRRDDLTFLYFTGHGLKDDQGRLYLAMTNTKRDRLLFTGLSAQQIDEAMDSCSSRQKVLVLDCCYSGAFPAGRIAKTDSQVNTLEKFQGQGRVVLTASDATQYSFEGNHIIGEGSQSVFTRFLVDGLTTGEADLDGDGDISLDELYSYVYDRVIEEMPQQRPKKQENVEGRIVIARNIHWSLPAHLRNAIESPIAAERLAALDGLAHLHRVGNKVVRAEVINQTCRLIHDDSKAVSVAAIELITALNPERARRETELQPVDYTTTRSGRPELEACADLSTPTGAATEKQASQHAQREAREQAHRKTDTRTVPSCWSEPVRHRYDEQTRRDTEGQDASETQAGGNLGPAGTWGLRRLARPQMVLAALVAVLIILLIVLVGVFTRSRGAGPLATTTTAENWTTFGGVAKQVGSGPDGKTIKIDTHDTTQNWRTKWSGLVAPGLAGCGWEISGRVHDLSHQVGVPGGIGIGLASLDGAGVPSGTAAQFDYGFSGYRATDYPSDDTLQQVRATLDHKWHDFDIIVGTDGRLKATIDNQPILDAQGKAVCGYPTIRVWAGAAEFSGLLVKPHN